MTSALTPSPLTRQEKTPASVAETEEVVAAGMEPELTPEEDFKARRLNAIKAKALEIEKVIRFAPWNNAI